LQSGDGSSFVGFNGNDQTFVVSNAFNDGAWKYKNSAGAGYYAIQGVSNGVHAWFTAPSGTAGNAISFTQAMTLDASGNLGVGTTSPGGRISADFDGAGTKYATIINSTGTIGFQAYGSFGTAHLRLTAPSVADWDFLATSSLAIVYNGSERARIDSSGNLLVGATSAVLSSKFLSQFDGNSHNGAILDETANTTSATFLAFTLSGTAIGSVARVGATSAVIYNTTSDQRLKSNIQTAAPVLEKLMQVQVRQYDWTVGDLHQEYGFIAQELEPVLSGVVTKGKTEEDMWQLDYSRLTPHLVKAIQELKAEFDAYKASHP
jgi:hypothetical protein